MSNYFDPTVACPFSDDFLKEFAFMELGIQEAEQNGLVMGYYRTPFIVSEFVPDQDTLCRLCPGTAREQVMIHPNALRRIAIAHLEAIWPESQFVEMADE